jgi:hypothetical protein
MVVIKILWDDPESTLDFHLTWGVQGQTKLSMDSVYLDRNLDLGTSTLLYSRPRTLITELNSYLR